MSEFLRACKRENTAFTPIWLMRQAGRYQPEYRAIRQKLSFVELCRNSDAATEVTVLPVTQLGVDAAILFADILLVLEPLGIGFEFTKDDGPHIARPVRTKEDIARVSNAINAEESLSFVMDTIRKTRRALPQGIPLIGFAGAPFTLASYAVEGGGSRNYHHTKALMYTDPGAFSALMEKLTSATANYLNAQVSAGAQAIQVFDSWVGCLSPADYQTHILRHMQRLFAEISGRVPVIHFANGNPALYPLARKAGGDVMGLDWRTSLGEQWAALGDVAVQGNLDPASLLAPRPVLETRAQAILDEAKGRPGHIFNLGHGLFPEASVDQVRALVEYVHQASAR